MGFFFCLLFDQFGLELRVLGLLRTLSFYTRYENVFSALVLFFISNVHKEEMKNDLLPVFNVNKIILKLPCFS